MVLGLCLNDLFGSIWMKRFCMFETYFWVFETHMKSYSSKPHSFPLQPCKWSEPDFHPQVRTILLNQSSFIWIHNYTVCFSWQQVRFLSMQKDLLSHRCPSPSRPNIWWTTPPVLWRNWPRWNACWLWPSCGLKRTDEIKQSYTKPEHG